MQGFPKKYADKNDFRIDGMTTNLSEWHTEFIQIHADKVWFSNIQGSKKSTKNKKVTWICHDEHIIVKLKLQALDPWNMKYYFRR
jgi:hypothetical protein